MNNNNDSIDNIGSDQAQIERDGNESTGRCEDVYDEHQENNLFDIDKQKDNDKAISDGEEDTPTKTSFGHLLMVNNGSNLDDGKTAKKPARGVSFIAISGKNRL